LIGKPLRMLGRLFKSRFSVGGSRSLSRARCAIGYLRRTIATHLTPPQLCTFLRKRYPSRVLYLSVLCGDPCSLRGSLKERRILFGCASAVFPIAIAPELLRLAPPCQRWLTGRIHNERGSSADRYRDQNRLPKDCRTCTAEWFSAE